MLADSRSSVLPVLALLLLSLPFRVGPPAAEGLQPLVSPRKSCVLGRLFIVRPNSTGVKVPLKYGGKFTLWTFPAVLPRLSLAGLGFCRARIVLYDWPSTRLTAASQFRLQVAGLTAAQQLKFRWRLSRRQHGANFGRQELRLYSGRVFINGYRRVMKALRLAGSAQLFGPGVGNARDQLLAKGLWRTAVRCPQRW